MTKGSGMERDDNIRDKKINEQFELKLKAAIQKGLLGNEVQWQMATDKLIRNFPKEPGIDAIPAAVLIMFYPWKGTVRTVLMKRPEYNGHHGGQICFPGGKKEASDENAIMTALREAQEETGCSTVNARITGTLTPLYIPVSNMLVTGVVCWFDEPPLFKPNKYEVDYLIDVELSKLLQPSAVQIMKMNLNDELYDVKYFNYEGHIIWGATAMIFNELLEIIKRDGVMI